MRRFGRVALGGTFDRFHIGHEALLGAAFQIGRSVTIGLTSRGFLAAHPKPKGRAIGSEATRRRALTRWLGAHYAPARWTVVPLHDAYGGATEGRFDALVVSADTVPGGRAVNRERLRRGRPPVPLLVVPLALADDLEPVSSRRIRSGEIDRSGHRRSAIAVGLAVGAGSDRASAVRAVRRAFPRARIESRLLRTVGRPRPSLPRLAERARGSRDLGIVVVPHRRSGWRVAVRGRHAALDPRGLPGSTAGDLEEGLLRLLRPAGPRRR